MLAVIECFAPGSKEFALISDQAEVSHSDVRHILADIVRIGLLVVLRASLRTLIFVEQFGWIDCD